MRLSEPKVITIESITPIFIGSGETAKPISYVAGKNIIHLLNFDNFLHCLNKEKQQAYIDWIDSLTDKLSTLGEKITTARNDLDLKLKLIKERRIIERELSIERFIRTHLHTDSLRFVRSKDLILYSIPFTTFPGSNGFKLCLKNSQGQPYIPGTEIKGALRTCLLSTLLLENTHYDTLKGKIENFRRVFYSGDLPKKKMEELRKISSSLEDEIFRGKKKDAKFDLLKFIQVSDSNAASIDNLRIETTQSLGSRGYTKTSIEAITKGEKFSFQIFIHERLRDSDKWVLEKLGLDKEYLIKMLDVDMLLEASYIRSKTILEEEKKYPYPANVQNQIKELKELNQKDSPLLRLGSGQGFLSTTVDIHVKTRDPELFNGAIREGVSFQRRWRTQKGNFPKTRRVVIDTRGNAVSLLGWIKLRL